MKITATLAATSMAVAVAADHTSRELIIGGTDVPKNTIQFVCAARPTRDGENICVGALFKTDLVLTTATCAANFNLHQQLYVSCGSTRFSGQGEGEQIKVVSVTNHSSHNYEVGSYNFAILKLEKPSTLPTIALPKADDSDFVAGALSHVFGWGFRNESGPMNQDLQVVSLTLWSQLGCSPTYNGIPNDNFCAGGVPGKDICKCDDGALLVKQKQKGDTGPILIGLGAFSDNCGRERRFPSVFNRASSAVIWANSVL